MKKIMLSLMLAFSFLAVKQSNAMEEGVEQQTQLFSQIRLGFATAARRTAFLEYMNIPASLTNQALANDLGTFWIMWNVNYLTIDQCMEILENFSNQRKALAEANLQAANSTTHSSSRIIPAQQF